MPVLLKFCKSRRALNICIRELASCLFLYSFLHHVELFSELFYAHNSDLPVLESKNCALFILNLSFTLSPRL